MSEIKETQTCYGIKAESEPIKIDRVVALSIFMKLPKHAYSFKTRLLYVLWGSDVFIQNIPMIRTSILINAVVTFLICKYTR